MICDLELCTTDLRGEISRLHTSRPTEQAVQIIQTVSTLLEHEVLERNNSPTFFTLFNSKLNRLQRYDTVQNCRILTEWFSIFPNITSKFHTIVTFKSLVRQNNDSNIQRVSMYMISCRTKLHLSNWKCPWRVYTVQQKIWILTFNRPPRSNVSFFSQRWSY
jgi:hypothetical protein